MVDYKSLVWDYIGYWVVLVCHPPCHSFMHYVPFFLFYFSKVWDANVCPIERQYYCTLMFYFYHINGSTSIYYKCYVPTCVLLLITCPFKKVQLITWESITVPYLIHPKDSGCILCVYYSHRFTLDCICFFCLYITSLEDIWREEDMNTYTPSFL